MIQNIHSIEFTNYLKPLHMFVNFEFFGGVIDFPWKYRVDKTPIYSIESAESSKLRQFAAWRPVKSDSTQNFGCIVTGITLTWVDADN